KLDISNGKENIRISCVNSIRKTDILVYNEEQFVCGCTDNCQIVPVDDIKNIITDCFRGSQTLL
ncbi:hypothetical protein CEXT_479791, partial [Caerostris extrusa]